jgi:RimJ/RimL family protein N-acetyltransferase
MSAHFPAAHPEDPGGTDIGVRKPPVFRPAREGDLDVICAIAGRAWARIHDSYRARLGDELHSLLCPEWEREKAAALRRHWERHPAWMWVAEVDDQIQGFFTFSLDPERRIGTIANNAVEPAAQGQGLGTAMYARVLALFREAGMEYARVHTGLDEGHAPARRAYEKAGFDRSIPDVTYYQKL